MTSTQLSAHALTGFIKLTFTIATFLVNSSTAPAYLKFIKIQKAPLNGITLGHRETESCEVLSRGFVNLD
jgi:hypothetical protein